MNLRNLFGKTQHADALESQSKNLSGENMPTEPVKNSQAFSLEELTMEESLLVIPFLDKLKEFCKKSALKHSGKFGGVCDACSCTISGNNFYLLGSWARCEECMDKVLYKNTNWYFYLVNLESWGGSIPQNLILEGAKIRDDFDQMRRAASGDTTLDLTGSVWDYRQSDGKKGFYRFEANGSLRYKELSDIERGGTWRQDGNAIYMEMNNRFCEFIGTTTGTRIEGEAHNVNGVKWSWYAYRSWARLAIL